MAVAGLPFRRVVGRWPIEVEREDGSTYQVWVERLHRCGHVIKQGAVPRPKRQCHKCGG